MFTPISKECLGPSGLKSIINTYGYDLQYKNEPFIINLSNTVNDNIIFNCYSQKKCYEIKFNLNDLKIINSIFEIYNNTIDIFNFLVKALKNNNFIIKSVDSNKLFLEIDLNNICNFPKISDNKIKIYLIKKAEQINEYEVIRMVNKISNDIYDLKLLHKREKKLKELVNQLKEENIQKDKEITELKKLINGNKGNYINDVISEKSNNSRKNDNYNNIKKSNTKSEKEKSEKFKKEKQITKKDNEIEKEENYLKKFNEKYITNLNGKESIVNLSFDEDNMTENRPEQKIGNNGFYILSKIKFDRLRKLYLENNDISDINYLEYGDFSQLESLNFYQNKISDINVLNRVNFRGIKELGFEKNKISDISVLGKIKFPNLEVLILDSNEISDISIFKSVNLPSLKRLNLYNNKIRDISILKDVCLDNLEILVLGNNEIKNINSLESVTFYNLKELYLCENEISDITVFEKTKFSGLELLNLSYNKFEDLSVFKRLKFNKLKNLRIKGIDLSFNNNELIVQKLRENNIEVII